MANAGIQKGGFQAKRTLAARGGRRISGNFCKNSCSEANFSKFWALLYAVSPVSQIRFVITDSVMHAHIDEASKVWRRIYGRAYHSTAVVPRSELPTQRKAPTSENGSSRLSTYYRRRLFNKLQTPQCTN